ncbi:TPA: 5-(carboxyamino)imidazole ribonucleotide mutase [bacterium]|nr:5-(carboxyamino)imidazole ribonucleotide mutase [bacterium]
MKIKEPKVGIVMDSDSDLSAMQGAGKIFQEFLIDYEIKIISAHRTPDKAFKYAKKAEKNGVDVIIAGAGGAAHLAGVIAAITPLPVIGIPIKTSTLNGVDSLLSIVQMPSGVPVTTVAINNAKNGAILAAEILGIKYPDVRKKIVEYKRKMTKER